MARVHFFFLSLSLSLSASNSSPSFLGEYDQHPPSLNLQLLLAVVQGEVQGEDEEDYMKKEGMIRSSKHGSHCRNNRLYFSPVYYSIKLSRFPKLTNISPLVRTGQSTTI